MSMRDTLIEWLRDAYAMERGMEQMWKRTCEDPRVSASMREIARQHLAETNSHAVEVERCLKLLGSDTSLVKTGIAEASGLIQETLTSFASDKRVKDLLTACAGEHFEIACYTAIQTAAQILGEESIMDSCDSIIADEKRMAKWLEQNVADVVHAYLSEGR